MWLERLTGGGAELVSLDAAKAHLRLLDAEVDAEVQAAIRAASRHLDVDADGFGGLGFPLVAQQWVARGAGFTPRLLRLPFAQVRAIDALRYQGADGVPGEVAAEDYLLVRQGRGAEIRLLAGRSWPQVAERPDAVELVFTAGFAEVGTVPDDIVEAAKQLVSFYFHNRGAEGLEAVDEEVARCVDRLTARYRRFAT